MKLDVLVVGAHPDDAEIGLAGTVSLLVAAGAKVGVVDLTRGEMGTRGTEKTRAAEAEAATRTLGLAERFNMGLPDGRVEANVENREALAKIIRACKPDVLIAHHTEDLHPDHIAAGHLARQAWYLAGLKRLAQLSGDSEAHRPGTLFHYMTHVAAEPDLVVDITSVWEKKLEVVRCYGSQIQPQETGDNGKHFLFGADIEQRMTTKARYFGEKIGVHFGEPLLHVGPLPARHGLSDWLAHS